MRLVDSHCHLDVADFTDDLPQVLARGREAGISAFVVPAIAFAGWPGLAALATAEPDIKPAYGLHPMFIAEHTQTHLDALPDWLARPECVARSANAVWISSCRGWTWRIRSGCSSNTSARPKLSANR